MGKGRDLGAFTDDVVDQIFRRDKNRCARCRREHDRRHGRGLLWSIHHRAPRGAGGSRKVAWIGDVSNGVILCGHGTIGCHKDVEKFRLDSRVLGFIVSRIGIRKSHEIPIRHAVHGWCRLTQEGGHEPCDPPDA